MKTRQEIVSTARAVLAKVTPAFNYLYPKRGKSIAVQFSSLFLDWQDTFPPKGGRKEATQIVFLRGLNSTIPKEREKYRVHPAYMAGQYLLKTGLSALRIEARSAVDGGTATKRQVQLDAERRKSGHKQKRDNPKATGRKVPLAVFFRVMADCFIEPDIFRKSLREQGVKADVAEALAEDYEAEYIRLESENGRDEKVEPKKRGRKAA